MPIYVQYYVWLIAISLSCFVIERVSPWRRDQNVLRKAIGQDLFWLFFNGHYLGLLLAHVSGAVIVQLNATLHKAGLPLPESLQLMNSSPLWLQFVAFFLLKDFIEWNIHRMLHLVPALWELHKLHHSIEELDWIGNFRFHWGEVIVYKTLSYLPLVVLGTDPRVILIIAVISTLIGHLNHANVPISWGPFRYVLNSPKMHIWHHDVVLHGHGGQNFAIVFSIWDWLFGTAYWPEDKEHPERLGFVGMDRYPRNLIARLIYPLRLWKK